MARKSAARVSTPLKDEKKMCAEELEELALLLAELDPQVPGLEEDEDDILTVPAPSTPTPDPQATPAAPPKAAAKPKVPLSPDEDMRVRAMTVLYRLEKQSITLRQAITSDRRKVRSWKHFSFLQLLILHLARLLLFLYAMPSRS